MVCIRKFMLGNVLTIDFRSSRLKHFAEMTEATKDTSVT
jgi:hypothetical protein